jgi:hypothetical protein
MPQKQRRNKVYFTTDTQNAIIEYNKSTCEFEKNKIYENRIKYPFEKLAENILNTFKFSYFDVPKEDIQHEVVSMLIQKIHMYQEGKGKAFSYFSIVAKNYLILNNNSNYKRYKNTLLISEMPENWNPENSFYSDELDSDYSEFKDLILEYWDKNLTNVFIKKRDIQIADAILELIRRSHYIEDFNKKHLYLLVREITNCKTHYITKVVNIMKAHHKLLLDEYFDTGAISDTNIYNEFF